MSADTETVEFFDQAPNERAAKIAAWGDVLVKDAGIAEHLDVQWCEGWDGYQHHNEAIVMILLDRRLFMKSDVPDSVLRALLAHEVGHAWSKKTRARSRLSEEEVDADDFAATTTCGHCAATCVETYHAFYQALGATFAEESETHLALRDRVERIVAHFGDPGYCTCETRATVVT